MSELPPPSPERPPGRVGRYEILLPIGTGGMATVYLARTEVVDGLYRFVALKMMHPQIKAGDGDAAWQLIEEAKLAASIRHPNVVSVHEAADDPSGVFMVMDYVEGDTLSGLIRNARATNQRLPLPIVGRILCDALSGLHAAHELCDASGRPLNVVHRDYSPSNILVGVDGVTRLADFGVAKVEGRASGTTTGAIKGKIGYMAPEQVLAKRLDRRCDVWAAGVVAWECLAGRRLHRDDDQVATLFRIVQEEPPLLATARSDLPDELGAAVAAALTRDVENRCPTAAELRRRLTHAWRAVGPMADAAEVGEHVRRVVGERLAKQREQVTRVLELRAQSGRASPQSTGHDGGHPQSTRHDPQSPGAVEPVTETAPTSRMGAPPEALEAPTERDAMAAVTAIPLPALRSAGPSSSTDGAQSAAPEPRARRAPWAYALAAVAAFGLLAGGRWMADGDRRRGEQVSAGAAQAIESAAASAAPPATAAPSTTASASASAPASGPVVVKVRANAAIGSLQVGQRAIVMAQPQAEVEIQLSDSEHDGPLRIAATAVDGRRAWKDLVPGTPLLVLVFTGASRQAVAPTHHAPAAAPAHRPAHPLDGELAPPVFQRPRAPSPSANQ